MHRARRLLAAALALPLLTLAGCGGAPALGERAIVKAIFVDKERQYQVGLAVLEETEGENGEEKAGLQLCSGSGDTLAEALQQAEASQPRRPFYAQNQLLLVGRQAAEQQLPAVLDYFAAEQASRPNMAVYLADLDLETLEQLAKTESLTADLFRLESSLSQAGSARMIYELQLDQQGAGGLVPVLAQGEQGLAVEGLALYRQQQLAEMLQGQQAALAGLLLGETEPVEWMQDTSLGQLRLRVDSPVIQRQLCRTEEGPVLRLTLQGTVRDLSAADPSLQQQAAGWQSREELSREISQSLSQQLQQLVDRCWQPGGDPFRLGWWFGAWNTRWYYAALDSGALYQPGRIQAQAEIRVL